jgi:hypothetical protein
MSGPLAKPLYQCIYSQLLLQLSYAHFLVATFMRYAHCQIEACAPAWMYA